MLLVILNQTFMNNNEVEKLTINHLKRSYYYFEGNLHLCHYSYENEQKQKIMVNYNHLN